MAEIISNLEFVKTQYATSSQDNTFKTINTEEMLDYDERKEACDYTTYNGTTIDENSIDTERAFNYYNYRVGSTGGFNARGDLKKEEANKLMERYKPKSMYRIVFSFENDFAQETNIILKNNMQELITKSMPKVIRDMGLEPDNVEWGGYYHTNTDHPHVHVWVFEKQKTKDYLKLPKSTFKKMRSDIIRTLGLNAEMYIKRDETKQHIIDSLKEYGLNDESMKYYLEGKKNSRRTFKFDKDITNDLLELEKVIPHTGSLKYNSKNIRPYHQQIEKIIDKLLKTDEVKDFYDIFQNQLMQEKRIFDKRYFSDQEKMKKNKSIENKDRELRDRIANMILANIKNYRLDKSDYEETFKDDQSRKSKNEDKKEGKKEDIHIKDKQRLIRLAIIQLE